MFRRIECSWITEEWPYDGAWPVYIFAVPPPQMDQMLGDAFALQQLLISWNEVPHPALNRMNDISLNFLGGVFQNSLFVEAQKASVANLLVRDFQWPMQPSMTPFVGIQHFRIINGIQTEIRGECLFLYPAPPVDDPKLRKDINFWDCAALFEEFKSQTKMSQNWKLNLPITDKDLPKTGLVYIMESENRGRYKIGWTARDAGERLSEIRTANSEVRLIDAYSATKQIETMLHKVFADKRVRESKEAGNEWFDLEEEDLAWIKRILS